MKNITYLIRKKLLRHQIFMFSLREKVQEQQIYDLTSSGWLRNEWETWKSTIILRMAVSTMLAVARLLAFMFFLLPNEAGQSNCIKRGKKKN